MDLNFVDSVYSWARYLGSKKGAYLMELKKYSPEEIRSSLITFAIVLSYIVFLTMGMIIRKHLPIVDRYLDISIVPIGISTIAFLYLFAITYEKRRQTKLSPEVLEASRLYGEGKSFEEIKEVMELTNVSVVKRLLTRYCKETA